MEVVHFFQVVELVVGVVLCELEHLSPLLLAVVLLFVHFGVLVGLLEALPVDPLPLHLLLLLLLRLLVVLLHEIEVLVLLFLLLLLAVEETHGPVALALRLFLKLIYFWMQGEDVFVVEVELSFAIEGLEILLLEIVLFLFGVFEGVLEGEAVVVAFVFVVFEGLNEFQSLLVDFVVLGKSLLRVDRVGVVRKGVVV